MTGAIVARYGADYLSHLIHKVHEAGTRPELWGSALGAIAASLGCAKALLFTPYHAPRQGGFVFPFGISAATLELWATTYIELDLWSQGGRERDLWRTGDVLVDTDMASFDELLASRFYTEFLSKIGIGRVCTGCVFANAPGTMATSLAVFRRIDEPAFTGEERAWLKLVVPHVSRSLGLMQRLHIAQAQTSTLLEVLDRSDSGIVLMNAALQAHYLNKAARKVVARGDGLMLNERNQLESLAPKGRKGLGAWLAEEIQALPQRPPNCMESFVIPRSNGAGRYVAQVSRLAPSSTLHAHLEPGYLVLISDPEQLRLPATEQLMGLYQLTRAQANVALEFARGSSYAQVAEELGVTAETVRSHVKEIYPKTCVNRQADLVRLVLALGRSAI